MQTNTRSIINMTKGKANGTATVADPAAASRRRAGAAQREDKPSIPARSPRLRRAAVAAERADDQPGDNPGNTGPARQPGPPETAPPVRKGAGTASRATQPDLALPRVRTTTGTGKAVSKLVRSFYGPHKQSVMTLSQVTPAAASLLEPERTTLDEDYSTEEKQALAFMAAGLLFVGILIGSAVW